MTQFFLVLMLAQASSAAIADTIKIENFRSGLVCPGDAGGSGRICFETDTIHITGQGRCTYDGKDERCTWYGYEFDYQNAKSSDEIHCIVASSKLVDIGNPEGVTARDATKYEYALKMTPGSGRFYNPQYSLLAFVNEGESEILDETVCSIGGKEALRFRFRLIYPAAH